MKVSKGRKNTKENFDSAYLQDQIFETANIGMCVTDIYGNFVKVNTIYCEMFGYSRQELLGKPFILILPEDARKYAASLHYEFLQGLTEEHSGEWKLMDKLGHIKEVSITDGRIITDTGEKYKITTVTDITEKNRDMGKLQKALQEKDSFIKEMHHRIKNNMNVISGLLFLQAEKVKNNPGTYRLFQESMDRIKAMSIIHEQLYNQHNFSAISMKEYVSSLSRNLQSTYIKTAHKVAVDLNIDDIQLDMDKAIACGLIINEAVSNSLKYAFPPSQPGKIGVHMFTENERVTMKIHDNGKGLDPDFDLQKTSTLGMQLIKILSGQLKGKLFIDGSQGTVVNLIFDA